MKEIIVLRRDHWGTAAYYPVCEAAHGLARIAGTKTLTHATLDEIKRMGVTIRVTRPEPEPSEDMFTMNMVTDKH